VKGEASAGQSRGDADLLSFTGWVGDGGGVRAIYETVRKHAKRGKDAC